MINDKKVIIFARAPRLFNGKRRLARDVGNLRAFLFYRKNLKRLIQALHNSTWDLHIAVASKKDAKHRFFKHASVIVQPEGDLGHRMATVLAQFEDNYRLIVGSDIPLLDCQHVEMAFNALAEHDLVVGPSPDGGYWCIGGNPKFSADAGFLQNVRWSSPHALADTLATVKPDTRVAKIASLADIDDGASLERYLKGSG